MNTVNVAVMSFAKYHAIEGSIEQNSNSHHVFFTLNLQVFDHGHVRGLRLLPWLIGWKKRKNVNKPKANLFTELTSKRLQKHKINLWTFSNQNALRNLKTYKSNAQKIA